MKYKHFVGALAVITYVSLSACFYTMNDSASLKWLAFGVMNLFMTWAAGLASLET